MKRSDNSWPEKLYKTLKDAGVRQVGYVPDAGHKRLIELCLAEGLSRFDAGTQGPHKLARGFEPTLTRSAHRLADERLAAAVAAFLAEERSAVARHQSQLAEHSAYRHETAAHG